MTYAIKPLNCDPKKLSGLSEKLIVSHWENNYGGAVRRLNAIATQLAELDFAKAPVFLINGLKREELIAMNSMILHELYRVRRHGQGDGWRLGMGAPHLLAPRPQTGEPVGGRPHAQRGGRHADPGARHVRALVPPRLRRRGGEVRRCVHGEPQLDERSPAPSSARAMKGRNGAMKFQALKHTIVFLGLVASVAAPVT